MPLPNPTYYFQLMIAYGYATNGWIHVTDTTQHTGDFCAVMALDSGLSLSQANSEVSAGSIAGDIPLPVGAPIPGPFTKLALAGNGNALFFKTPPEFRGTL